MSHTQPSSRGCFLCGRQNPVGLHVVWQNDTEARQVRARIEISDQYCSYPGIVHGGIVAALLDETAGRAIMLDGDWNNLMVTLKMSVTYRRPTPTRTPLTVVGWVLKETSTRAQVAGEIRLDDGTVTAKAELIIVRPPAGMLDPWEAEKEFWRVYADEDGVGEGQGGGK